ncbi:hypothetical protein VTI74DRAFT_7134 [Chaetomium olivicolor]
MAVVECVNANKDGFVTGCPKCNARHNWEQCRLRAKNRAEDFLYLVTMRPNHPPLLTYDICSHKLWVQQGRPRTKLPGTVAFSKDVATGRIKPQGFDPETFIYSGASVADAERLPEDPTVCFEKQDALILPEQTFRKNHTRRGRERSKSPSRDRRGPLRDCSPFRALEAPRADYVMDVDNDAQSITSSVLEAIERRRKLNTASVSSIPETDARSAATQLSMIELDPDLIRSVIARRAGLGENDSTLGFSNALQEFSFSSAGSYYKEGIPDGSCYNYLSTTTRDDGDCADDFCVSFDCQGCGAQGHSVWTCDCDVFMRMCACAAKPGHTREACDLVCKQCWVSASPAERKDLNNIPWANKCQLHCAPCGVKHSKPDHENMDCRRARCPCCKDSTAKPGLAAFHLTQDCPVFTCPVEVCDAQLGNPCTDHRYECGFPVLWVETLSGQHDCQWKGSYERTVIGTKDSRLACLMRQMLRCQKNAEHNVVLATSLVEVRKAGWNRLHRDILKWRSTGMSGNDPLEGSPIVE